MTADDRRPTGPPDTDQPPLSPRTQWLVLILVIGMLLIVPVALLIWPPTLLSFQDAYLGASLIPGLVLGVLIVWLATRDT